MFTQNHYLFTLLLSSLDLSPFMSRSEKALLRFQCDSWVGEAIALHAHPRANLMRDDSSPMLENRESLDAKGDAALPVLLVRSVCFLWYSYGNG